MKFVALSITISAVLGENLAAIPSSVSLTVSLNLVLLQTARAGNGSMGHGSWVKWVTKIGWVTWVMGY